MAGNEEMKFKIKKKRLSKDVSQMFDILHSVSGSHSEKAPDDERRDASALWFTIMITKY